MSLTITYWYERDNSQFVFELPEGVNIHNTIPAVLPEKVDFVDHKASLEYDDANKKLQSYMSFLMSRLNTKITFNYINSKPKPSPYIQDTFI